jgi:hypothetical protein
VLIVQVDVSKCPTDGSSCKRYVRDGKEFFLSSTVSFQKFLEIVHVEGIQEIFTLASVVLAQICNVTTDSCRSCFTFSVEEKECCV